MLKLQAKLIQEIEAHQGYVACEEFVGESICGKPAEYLVPDATRAGGGGRDVELRPACFCREHLEKMLGHPPEEQPIFRRVIGPE